MITLFKKVVEKYKDQKAVSFGNRYLTYRDLDLYSDKIAQLIIDSGHTPEECPYIGLYSQRSILTVPMMIGIWKAGFTYVPMDPKHPVERIAYMIGDCRLKLILSDCGFPSGVNADVRWTNISEDSIKTLPHRILQERKQARFAYVIYTSGTTGQPKGTPITHQALRNLIEARKALIPPEKNLAELGLASIVFDVSVWEIFCSIMTGTRLYLVSEIERNDPKRIVELLEEQHITTFSITPTHLSVIPYRQFPELKYLVFAGEPCPKELIRKWQQTCSVIDAYGPTEATVIATACFHGPDSHPNDIGLPLQGVTCYVLDEHLQQVPKGEKGELFIGGIQLTEGYLNKEEINRKKFISNPFATADSSDPVLYASGDIVYQQPDNHIIYCGRKDNQVKIHGYRIELGEVKAAIEACQSVEAAAVEVVGTGNQKHLRAFYTKSSPQYDAIQLKNELKEKLPFYMVPTQLIELETIPKNINGKTDFQALDHMMSLRKEEDFVTDGIEKQLAAIWHQVLNYGESIRSDSNFLDIGGDSISIILMMQEVNSRFHIELTVRDVYASTVLSHLAEVVRKAPSVKVESENIALREIPTDKIFLPEHSQLVYAHCLHSQEASAAYNLVELVAFRESFQKDRVLSAWNRILESQDALRMTFHTDEDGKPFVTVHDYLPIDDITITEVTDENMVRAIVQERLSLPFRLEKDALYRLEIYRFEEKKWILAIYIHHLISDGWSLDELHQQVVAAYHNTDKIETGSYAHYLYDTYYQEQANQGVIDRTYWQDYVKDCQELLLPTIFLKNNTHNYKGDCITADIDDDLTILVRRFCQQHHLTLFSFLSSAFLILLYRFSRQQSFTIGFPTAGRIHGEYFHTQGYFVHPRPIRFETEWLDTTFVDACLHTMAHVQQTEGHRLSMVNLPPVNFTMETMRSETRLGVVPPYALAPLTLTVDIDSDHMQCRWLFRKAVVDSDALLMMSNCYVALLQNIVRDGSLQSKVRSLSLLSSEEYAAIRNRNTISPIQSSSESIIDVLKRQVSKYPEHIALKDETGTVSYLELDRLSDGLSDFLYEHVKGGNAIGLFTDRRNLSLLAIMGIIKSGNFYVPISHTYPDERIRDIVADSGMRAILTIRQYKEAILSVCPDHDVFVIEDIIESYPLLSTSLTLPPLSVHTIAYMIYTSGTTGRPKGVPITHGNIVSMVTIGAPGVFCPTHEDRVLQFSTYLFDASAIDIFTTLLSGATLVTAPEELKRDPEKLFAFIADEHISWACFPPSFLHICKQEAPKELRTILVGGESPSPSVIERYRNIKFVNGYGPTENTVCSTAHIFWGNAVQDSNCIGVPLSGVSCYILDDDRNLLPDGVIGELYLGGLQLSIGYHDRPELNEKCFIENSFVTEADHKNGQNELLYATGDIVWRKADGNIYFFGRKDFQVKLRGFRIELADIENALLAHPAVTQCVVEIRSFEDNKQLVAHIATESIQLEGKQLRDFLSEKLPQYMIPTFWTFSQHLPLTDNGKIDREKLRHLELCFSQQNAEEQELNQEEFKCSSIVARLLGIDLSAVSVEGNLISDLGMSSLQVLEFASQMRGRGYNLKPSDIYRLGNIRRLVDYYTSDDSNRELTPEQIASRICYFTSPVVKGKPVLLVVSGYPYYETEYYDFDNYFKNDYNILVIDSANEYFMWHPDAPLTIDALMDGYVEILKPILKKYQIAGVTGLCIGGDMGLRLAVELNALGLARPKVFVLDGYAKRTTYANGLGSFVIEPDIDSDLNLRRNQIMRQMTDTFEQKYYVGETHLLMTTHFGDEYGQTKEEGEAIHPYNKQKWLEAQPDVIITYLDGLHMELLHNPRDLKQIKDVIDRCMLSENTD